MLYLKPITSTRLFIASQCKALYTLWLFVAVIYEHEFVHSCSS